MSKSILLLDQRKKREWRVKNWTLKEFNCPPFVHIACKHFDDDGFDNNTYMHIDIITLKQGQE